MLSEVQRVLDASEQKLKYEGHGTEIVITPLKEKNEDDEEELNLKLSDEDDGWDVALA